MNVHPQKLCCLLKVSISTKHIVSGEHIKLKKCIFHLMDNVPILFFVDFPFCYFLNELARDSVQFHRIEKRSKNLTKLRSKVEQTAYTTVLQHYRQVFSTCLCLSNLLFLNLRIETHVASKGVPFFRWHTQKLCAFHIEKTT